ncbi:MAG: outer membrane lipoprotein-sorting protein [Aestuariivita sp.]|nr:outer membrane lipoprotein-sorting protein [Aestuariivita sp.]
MSSTTRNVVFLILVIFGMSDAWSEAEAQSASEKGLEIARAAHNNDTGFGNLRADMTMILRDRRGQENKRSIRIQVLEVPNDGDKVLFVFDNPRDVKGTAFLTHGHRIKPDDQWLYLPALKRVKRISSSNRSGSFMGSEFSYQDLNYPEVEKYSYTWLKDEKCGELICSVTEWVPVEKGSGYTRQLVWHDTKEYRIIKVEYFDRRNSHLKTLTYEGYNQYLGEFWRADKQFMVNHVTGKSTDLIWSNFEFKTDMNERDFSQAGLRRVR